MIPLALLLRNQAQNRALSRSETLAQAIATALVVDTTRTEDAEVSPVAAQTVLEVFGSGADAVTILFADGSSVGAPVFSTDNIDVTANTDIAVHDSANTVIRPSYSLLELHTAYPPNVCYVAAAGNLTIKLMASCRKIMY